MQLDLVKVFRLLQRQQRQLLLQPRARLFTTNHTNMGGKVKFVTKLADFNKEIGNENLTIVDAYATW